MPKKLVRLGLAAQGRFWGIAAEQALKQRLLFTMDNSSNIESVVMRRVRRISWLRIVVSGGVFAFGVAGIALWGIGKEVWVAKVFENGPQDFFGHLRYLVYAFLHTRFVVQGLVVITVASFLFFAREIVRGIVSYYAPLGG